MKFKVTAKFEMPASRRLRRNVWGATLFGIAFAMIGLSTVHAVSPRNATLPEFADWRGTVTYVVDGDTLYVRPADSRKSVSVRIDGIDAPEICQSGGVQAREELRTRVLGQQVLVHPKANDRYGRLVASIVMDNVDQGGQMVAAGQAWAFRFSAGRGPYAPHQRYAEAARLGVFSAEVRPQTPALFRKMHGFCS